MAAKTHKLGEHEVDVRMHEDRLVLKIEVADRERAQAIYKDLVAKGLLVPVRLS